MPHESTVAHEQRFVMETPTISRTRMFKIKENNGAILQNYSDAQVDRDDKDNANSTYKNGNTSKVLVRIRQL